MACRSSKKEMKLLLPAQFEPINTFRFRNEIFPFLMDLKFSISICSIMIIKVFKSEKMPVLVAFATTHWHFHYG